MKTGWMRVIFLLLLSYSLASLTLMSYNIRSGSGIDNVYNLTRTADVIRGVFAASGRNPLLVGMQEVDQNTTRHPVDQPAELAKMTGLYPVYGKMRNFENGGYGILVLSSLRPIKSLVFHYNGTSPENCHDTEPRDFCQGAVAVLVEARDGHVWFVTTHLGLEGVQLAEAEQLINWVSKALVPTAPTFITGDFNSVPTDPAIKYASSHWTDLHAVCGGGGPGFTFNSSQPFERIDYVFSVRPSPACKVQKVLDTQASDHRPVVTFMS